MKRGLLALGVLCLYPPSGASEHTFLKGPLSTDVFTMVVA